MEMKQVVPTIIAGIVGIGIGAGVTIAMSSSSATSQVEADVQTESAASSDARAEAIALIQSDPTVINEAIVVPTDQEALAEWQRIRGGRQDPLAAVSAVQVGSCRPSEEVGEIVCTVEASSDETTFVRVIYYGRVADGSWRDLGFG